MFALRAKDETNKICTNNKAKNTNNTDQMETIGEINLKN